MNSKPLLVLGSINADLSIEIAALPQPGETIAGHDGAVRSGGKGANQAAAAAKLGFPTRFAGRLGSDAFAPALRAELRSTGTDESLLVAVPGPSGRAYILLQRGGENSIIVTPGANAMWQGLDAQLTLAIQQAGALLLQREIPGSINLAAALVAQAAGVPVVLDVGGSDVGPLPLELLACLAVCTPNETELARLTGLPTTDGDQVVAAARALQRQGVGMVVVKLGARGCLAVQADGSILTQSVFRVPVVDTTGAGDCFTGAYAVALLEGQPAHTCLRFACAAAAVSVQRKGAMASMPTRIELQELLNRA